MRQNGRPADPVEVLIVDDQPEFRTVLRDLVNVTPGMTVVGEACTGEAALEAAADLAPRLVIMDIRMPGRGGVEATRRLVERHARIVVFLVSIDGHDEDLRSYEAATFLNKQTLLIRVLRQAWDHARNQGPAGSEPSVTFLRRGQDPGAAFPYWSRRPLSIHPCLASTPVCGDHEPGGRRGVITGPRNRAAREKRSARPAAGRSQCRAARRGGSVCPRVVACARARPHQARSSFQTVRRRRPRSVARLRRTATTLPAVGACPGTGRRARPSAGGRRRAAGGSAGCTRPRSRPPGAASRRSSSGGAAAAGCPGAPAGAAATSR